MSALQRSAMSARVAGLPRQQAPPPQARAPWAFPDSELGDEGEEEEEEEEDGLGDLPPVRIPGAGSTQSRTIRGVTRTTPARDYSPISASGLLTQAAQVSVAESGLDFRVYYTPPTANGPEGTVLVCHHGAGYSGLSFACFAQEVTDMSAGELGMLIMDARGHGRTTPINRSDLNADVLDLSVLAADFVNLLCTLFPKPAEAPSLILLGHSMGGTAVVHGCPSLLEKGYRVSGVAVLDVVEGSAMEALPHMHKLLDSRPDGFASQEAAIEWHITTNTIRNVASARVSVPSLVVPAQPGDTPAGHTWKWRTPLRNTSPYWRSWFEGLSEKFLAARTARLLVLAGTDRLDKTLMIGQMQGKFQMVVVPGVGHMLHEDNPEKLAEIIVEFWRRNERVVAGIKKVGDA
ncbi:protein phosphatase methylesterase 1 [Rhizoctonia solani AG-1 IB]|uniref:Protein phosphatase methylesterase 1 n=1 Tax=Thanatephorus cucumeris (strain AG1-IB / isolate 7/3/14) TaxID=1108050 RepID=A0A0B7FL34_THACB|nr:protein phosphatase methylesterase 1 [Rhizoctonia solani AG-1 IB]